MLCLDVASLSQLSVEPKKVIFVGDDYEADIQGAKNTSMKTIYLCKHPTDNEEGDVTIESLTEIPSAIKRLSQ